MAPKASYKPWPAPTYTEGQLPVGVLTNAFKTHDGPQRNRPADSPRWRAILRARSRGYGNYNPVLLRPRIVSDRGNGVYWPLDGNGSNHWLEDEFGPEFPVPVRFLTGLTLAEENRIFLDLQRVKQVTQSERYTSDREFNVESWAYKINKLMNQTGFHITPNTKDPWGIGVTTIRWVHSRYKEQGITTVLGIIAKAFSDDEWQRTNSSLVKAIASLWYQMDYNLDVPEYTYDHTLLMEVLQGNTAEELAEGARGAGGEIIVIPRIRERYEELATAPS